MKAPSEEIYGKSMQTSQHRLMLKSIIRL